MPSILRAKCYVTTTTSGCALEFMDYNKEAGTDYQSKRYVSKQVSSYAAVVQ